MWTPACCNINFPQEGQQAEREVRPGWRTFSYNMWAQGCTKPSSTSAVAPITIDRSEDDSARLRVERAQRLREEAEAQAEEIYRHPVVAVRVTGGDGHLHVL